jgi:YhcH/YjgK/YiaL family protein
MKEKDIEFFHKSDDNLLLADPTRYFVFFATERHKPCLKVGSFDKVRKVVVKIPI